jgi:hypothetical protein
MIRKAEAALENGEVCHPSHAPVTIPIDRRPDDVHLSYDSMASFLAPYENPATLKVARDLDEKIERLLAGVGF